MGLLGIYNWHVYSIWVLSFPTLFMLYSATTFLGLGLTAVLKCVYNPNEPNSL